MDNGASSYRRFLAGDNDALIDIMRDYKDGLILYINSFVRNICIAEELAEETFVKIVVKKPRFSGKSTFKTWLYSVGRYTTVDFIRKSSKKNHISIDELYDYSDEKNIERDYIKEEQKIMLHQALGKLNSDYSQVLYLTFFENFSNDETAKIMHKTKRQIENLVCRAKKALKAELEKEGFNYEGL